MSVRETPTAARETQTRTCSVCGRDRPSVLFPRNPANGKIRERCQMCRDVGAKLRPKDVIGISRARSRKAARRSKAMAEARDT